MKDTNITTPLDSCVHTFSSLTANRDPAAGLTLFVEPRIGYEKLYLSMYIKNSTTRYPLLTDYSFNEGLQPTCQLNAVEIFIKNFCNAIFDIINNKFPIKMIIVLPEKIPNINNSHSLELLRTLSWFRIIWKAKRIFRNFQYMDKAKIHSVLISTHDNNTLRVIDALSITKSHLKSLLTPYFNVYTSTAPSAALSNPNYSSFEICILLKLYCSRDNFLEQFDAGESNFLCDFLISNTNKARFSEKYNIISIQVPNSLLFDCFEGFKSNSESHLKLFNAESIIRHNMKEVKKWAKNIKLKTSDVDNLINIVLQDTYNNPKNARNALLISSVLYKNSTNAEIRNSISKRVCDTIDLNDLPYWFFNSHQAPIELAICLITSQNLAMHSFALGVIIQLGFKESIQYISTLDQASAVFDIFNENPSDWMVASNSPEINCILLQLSFNEYLY